MTIKPRMLLCTASLAVGLGAIPCSAFAADPIREGGAPRVYVAAEGCHGHFYAPKRKVILACADANLYVTGLSYSAYGSREAKAKGVFHVNDCTPNCAGGRFHTHAGTIRFFDVVRCADGRRYFARGHYSFPGQGGSGTADIAPLMRCRPL